MNIKERIKRIKEYFKEMQIVTVDNEQVIYVAVQFPHGWVIDESIEEKYNISIEKGNSPNIFYFATEIDNGEDKIFDAIEYNIIRMKDAIERAQLLKIKISELKDIFQNEKNSLDNLRNLKFTWEENQTLENNIIEAEIYIPDDTKIESVETNIQSDITTTAEVERQYTIENKKNKK